MSLKWKKTYNCQEVSEFETIISRGDKNGDEISLVIMKRPTFSFGIISDEIYKERISEVFSLAFLINRSQIFTTQDYPWDLDNFTSIDKAKRYAPKFIQECVGRLGNLFSKVQPIAIPIED